MSHAHVFLKRGLYVEKQVGRAGGGKLAGTSCVKYIMCKIHHDTFLCVSIFGA